MTREEIKKAMSDTKKEVVLKNLHKLLSLVEGHPEYEDCISYAIEKLEQEPTTKNDLGVDCISRAEAKAAIRDKFKDLPSRVEINTILNALPSVTPQEPRRGHWISTETKGVRYAFWCRYKCSLCGGLSDRTNFCPNCGARMVEPQESEDT